jgi:hypothetical protein
MSDGRYVPTRAIKEAVKGQETVILSALGIDWNGKTRHIRCPYPNHGDEHPSWRWDAAKRQAHCTCKPSASIFDVVCKVKGVDFKAAKITVAEMIGRKDLIRQRGATKKGGGARTPGGNTATAQHLPGCTLEAYAKAKGLPIDYLGSLGLADMTYLGQSAVRIPYFGADGTEAGMRFRLALEGEEKFRWRKGSKSLLYGLNRVIEARKANAIAIVEGESDCHTLWHAGFTAIGVPGAGNWNERRDAAIFDSIGRIYVVIEPDSGGDTVHKWLAKSKIRDRAKLVRLEGFKDASQLFLDDPARFARRWQAALEAAVPLHDEADRETQAAREEAWRTCADLGKCDDILSKVVEAVQVCGLVGEERAAKLIYLAVTSRVLSRIASIAVKGPSSGGKSFMVETVLKLFPPDAFYTLTSMSDHALAYGEEPLAHRMIVLYEAAGLTGDFGTYLIRSLLSENRICYDTVEKTKDGLRARRIEREGPTGLITTTTAVSLHPENETRLISVTVADTQEQTKAIMRTQAERQGTASNLDLAPWHALQKAIALGAASVEIPFARELADLIPPVAVRLRRDYPTLLALIKTHALLHQTSRKRTPKGAVIASFDDYLVVRELLADLISQGIGATVPMSVRETVKGVAELLSEANTDAISVTNLAKKLHLDKATASRRARDAAAMGYLKNLEDRRGRPARLVLGDQLPDDVEVLPGVEALKAKCCTVALNEEGVSSSPSPLGEVSPRSFELAEADV